MIVLLLLIAGIVLVLGGSWFAAAVTIGWILIVAALLWFALWAITAYRVIRAFRQNF